MPGTGSELKEPVGKRRGVKGATVMWTKLHISLMQFDSDLRVQFDFDS